MIAFYAWTDTLLLNAVNLKTGEFAAEQADLFVLQLPRVSPQLLQYIRQQHIFRNVILIPEPTEGADGLLHKIMKIFSGRQYYRMFEQSLSQVAGQQYRLLVTGGFWSYSLFMYRALARYNPQLELAFLEEGIASYAGEDMLLWCDPLNKPRSLLLHLLFYPGMFEAARRAAKTLYLYCPEACLSSRLLVVRPIGIYTPQTTALLAALGQQTDMDSYRTRSVIFFLQPETDADMERTAGWIRMASEEIGGEQILIKPHPDSVDRLESLQLAPEILIDRSRVTFESVLAQVDWSDKLLITKGTSCVFYPRYLLGQQPDVVFLFRQYPFDRLKDLIERLSARMRTLYHCPERVTVAQDAAQVRQAMQNWRQRHS